MEVGDDMNWTESRVIRTHLSDSVYDRGEQLLDGVELFINNWFIPDNST